MPKLTRTAIHWTCRSCQQNELVFLQVGYVVVRLIGIQLENQPSDMRKKKPFEIQYGSSS